MLEEAMWGLCVELRSVSVKRDGFHAIEGLTVQRALQGHKGKLTRTKSWRWWVAQQIA